MFNAATRMARAGRAARRLNLALLIVVVLAPTRGFAFSPNHNCRESLFRDVPQVRVGARVEVWHGTTWYWAGPQLLVAGSRELPPSAILPHGFSERAALAASQAIRAAAVAIRVDQATERRLGQGEIPTIEAVATTNIWRDGDPTLAFALTINVRDVSDEVQVRRPRTRAIAVAMSAIVSRGSVERWCQHAGELSLQVLLIPEDTVESTVVARVSEYARQLLILPFVQTTP
jgi:hypothetical protein